MSVSQLRHYKLIEFEFGVISRALRAMFDRFFLDPGENKFIAKYQHRGIEEDRSLYLDEIGSVCSLSDKPYGVSLGFFDDKHQWNYFCLSSEQDFLTLYVSCAKAEATAKVFEILEGALRLSRIPGAPPEEEELERLEHRLTEFEQRFRVTDERLTCVLSYRFNERSKVYGLELTRFLELAGVEVISGAGYEPRRVADGFRTGLNQPLDFIVYLMINDAETVQVREDLGPALAKGYAVLLLVEAGIQVEQGMIGDLKHFEFQPGHVSDCFIGLLEELRSIRRERRSPKTNT